MQDSGEPKFRQDALMPVATSENIRLYNTVDPEAAYGTLQLTRPAQ